MSKTWDSIFDMPIDELTKRVAKAKDLYAQIGALFPGLVLKTSDDRQHSDGKYKNGEADALGAVLNVAEASPQYFVPLADRDGGVDPETFETAFLRDQFERRNLLASVRAAGEPVDDKVNDTVLHLGEATKPVLLAAYRIAKPIAQVNTAVRSNLAPALDFYSKIGKRGADTRSAHDAQNTPTHPPVTT